MARTKNRGYQQTLAPTYTARLWKMGGYIRLSREDLQKINRGLDDSNSVKNQRDILNDFHHNHVDEFESYVEYVDDGHTGTDTERESFQRLLGDVMSGKMVLSDLKENPAGFRLQAAQRPVHRLFCSLRLHKRPQRQAPANR